MRAYARGWLAPALALACTMLAGCGADGDGVAEDRFVSRVDEETSDGGSAPLDGGSELVDSGTEETVHSDGSAGDAADAGDAGLAPSPLPPVPAPATLRVRILGATDQLAKVCLDSSRNLACEPTEPSGVAGTGGLYDVPVPLDASLDGLHLVVEVPASSSLGLADAKTTAPPASFTLAAPAARSAVVGALTTLVSVHMLQASTASSASVDSALKAQLGLPASASMLEDVDKASHAGLSELERAAMMALRGGAGAYARSSATMPTPAEGTRRTAPVLLRVLRKYVDPKVGRLFPTVTARTLVTETRGTFAPPRCAAQPPPSLRIQTAGGAPVLNREDYLEAELSVDATAAYPEAVRMPAEVRGRGNSTWDNMPKKPYKLKLQEAAPLLGMAEEKDWVLLANYADKTLMRNAVAMCLGQVLEMEHTPAYRYVELTMNGQYQGVYQLMEQVETGKNRVNIGPDAKDDADVEAGFLLEIDERLDEDLWFHSQMGLPYTVKSDATAAQVANIKAIIDAMEQALLSNAFADPAVGYVKHMDVESLIDFYLISELMRNDDAFFSSTFVGRTRGGKVRFGPLWDFDLAAGNTLDDGNDKTDGWWVRIVSKYVARMLEDPAFEAHLVARWTYLRDRMPALQQFIDETATALDAAQARNFQTWNILSVAVWPNPVVLGSYAGEVGYLKRWLSARATWMDAQMAPRARVLSN